MDLIYTSSKALAFVITDRVLPFHYRTNVRIIENRINYFFSFKHTTWRNKVDRISLVLFAIYNLPCCWTVNTNHYTMGNTKYTIRFFSFNKTATPIFASTFIDILIAIVQRIVSFADQPNCACSCSFRRWNSLTIYSSNSTEIQLANLKAISL